MTLVLAGHFATERFAVEQLAEVLTGEFPAATIWASQRERDPLQTVRIEH
jgi:putative NIF3 family GTP cyclohydrolase 1 type 2